MEKKWKASVRKWFERLTDTAFWLCVLVAAYVFLPATDGTSQDFRYRGDEIQGREENRIAKRDAVGHALILIA